MCSAAPQKYYFGRKIILVRTRVTGRVRAVPKPRRQSDLWSRGPECVIVARRSGRISSSSSILLGFCWISDSCGVDQASPLVYTPRAFYFFFFLSGSNSHTQKKLTAFFKNRFIIAPVRQEGLRLSLFFLVTLYRAHGREALPQMKPPRDHRVFQNQTETICLQSKE